MNGYQRCQVPGGLGALWGTATQSCRLPQGTGYLGWVCVQGMGTQVFGYKVMFYTSQVVVGGYPGWVGYPVGLAIRGIGYPGCACTQGGWLLGMGVGYPGSLAPRVYVSVLRGTGGDLVPSSGWGTWGVPWG